MSDDETYTYRLTVDTTLLDGDQYGTALEVLMDAFAAAAREIRNEGIPVRLVLSDTSTVRNTVLDLDYLQGPRFYIVSEKHGLVAVADDQETAEQRALVAAVNSGTVYLHDRETE